MTLDEILGCNAGTEVWWEDPDGGLCSRHVTIARVDYGPAEDTVTITEADGSVLEAHPEEFSW